MQEVAASHSAGKVYDRVGIKPMFVVGTGLYAVYAVMGFLFSHNTSIIYTAVVFALQSVAMPTLNL